MTSIKRDKVIAEELIRSYVRKRISSQLKRRSLFEQKIRSVVRSMLLEVTASTDEAPSRSTGINVLADLLEKIVPILEDDYKMLTTSEEQRESFKNHIVQAVKNSLKPIDAPAGGLPESVVFEIDKDLLVSEKLKIDLDASDDAEAVEGEFIDIEDQEADTFGAGLDDQNQTGRNFAASSFKKVETQIVDAYRMLADEEDQKVFYEYLLTNLLLYFDKFEDDISDDAPDQSTEEYEQEKDEESPTADDESQAEEELEI